MSQSENAWEGEDAKKLFKDMKEKGKDLFEDISFDEINDYMRDKVNGLLAYLRNNPDDKNNVIGEGKPKKSSKDGIAEPSTDFKRKEKRVSEKDDDEDDRDDHDNNKNKKKRKHDIETDRKVEQKGKGNGKSSGVSSSDDKLLNVNGKTDKIPNEQGKEYDIKANAEPVPETLIKPSPEEVAKDTSPLGFDALDLTKSILNYIVHNAESKKENTDVDDNIREVITGRKETIQEENSNINDETSANAEVPSGKKVGSVVEEEGDQLNDTVQLSERTKSSETNRSGETLSEQPLDSNITDSTDINENTTESSEISTHSNEGGNNVGKKKYIVNTEEYEYHRKSYRMSTKPSIHEHRNEHNNYIEDGETYTVDDGAIETPTEEILEASDNINRESNEAGNVLTDSDSNLNNDVDDSDKKSFFEQEQDEDSLYVDDVLRKIEEKIVSTVSGVPEKVLDSFLRSTEKSDENSVSKFDPLNGSQGGKPKYKDIINTVQEKLLRGPEEFGALEVKNFLLKYISDKLDSLFTEKLETFMNPAKHQAVRVDDKDGGTTRDIVTNLKQDVFSTLLDAFILFYDPHGRRQDTILPVENGGNENGLQRKENTCKHNDIRVDISESNQISERTQDGSNGAESGCNSETLGTSESEAANVGDSPGGQKRNTIIGDFLENAKKTLSHAIELNTAEEVIAFHEQEHSTQKTHDMRISLQYSSDGEDAHPSDVVDTETSLEEERRIIGQKKKEPLPYNNSEESDRTPLDEDPLRNEDTDASLGQKHTESETSQKKKSSPYDDSKESAKIAETDASMKQEYSSQLNESSPQVDSQIPPENNTATTARGVKDEL